MRVIEVAYILAGAVLVQLACAGTRATDHGSPSNLADARAAPNGLTAVDLPCNKSTTSEGIVFQYGEVEFPGRTMHDLARARVVRCGGEPDVIPGYDCTSTMPIRVRDGAIAYVCKVGETITLLVPAEPL